MRMQIGSTVIRMGLAAAIPAAAVLPIVACSTTTPVTEASVANDISLIATSLNNALSQPAVVAVIPATTLPKVQAALADLMTVTAAIKADPTSALSKGTVTSVETDVNTIDVALSGLPLPKDASTILQAAVVLLPVIEAAVGIVVPAAASKGDMSVDEARAHLIAGN